MNSFKSYERPIPNIDAICNDIWARGKGFLQAASESEVDVVFMREFEDMVERLVNSKREAHGIEMRSRYIEAQNDKLLEAISASISLRPMQPFIATDSGKIEIK